MPKRFNELIAYLEGMGLVVERGTRHYKVRRADGAVYTIPAHNGLRSEIHPTYARGLAKFLGVDPHDLMGRPQRSKQAQAQQAQQARHASDAVVTGEHPIADAEDRAAASGDEDE